MRETVKGLSSPVRASLALAFASLGDAFLYVFLPLNSHTVAVPMMWVGLLLSVNRIIRILFNTAIVWVFATFGLRSTMMFAVVLAVASTFGYAIATSVFAWLFLRVGWGIAFSALRTGTIGYALQEKKQGVALGVSKGIRETGPMVVLLMAPILLNELQPQDIFSLLALLSIPGLFFAWSLPKSASKPPRGENSRLTWPSTLNLLTFLSALIIDGVLVVALAAIFLEHRHGISLLHATSLAAFYLFYKRIAQVILSPIGGWLADRIGLNKVFTSSMALLIVGLFTFVSGWIAVGAVLVFTSYAVNSALTPAFAAIAKHSSLEAVAVNATWRDIGAAVGTMLGGLLLNSEYLTESVLFSILILSFLLLLYAGTILKLKKQFLIWK